MNRNLRFLLASLVAIWCCVGVAHADNVTVFDGTQVSPYVPLPTASYNEPGTRGQVIYPASELTAMVGQPIRSITLYVNNEGCKMSGGALRISMTEVEETAFTSTRFYTTLTQVALVEMRPGLEEIDIDFDTPYVYGGGNLVIDFYVQVAGESGAYNFTYFYGLYQQGHCSLTTGDEGNEYREFTPKTTFEYGETPAYSAKTSPRYVNFNTIRAGESDSYSVILRNNGLNAFTPAVTADAPFAASIPEGGLLEPGMTQEVVVAFEPVAAGTFNGFLHIDCGEAGILDVPLNGTALENGTLLTVCDGTATNQYVPFNGVYADDVNTRGQMIYPAEKLVGMKDGKIVALSFFTKAAINMKNVELQLSLKNTDQGEFAEAAPLTDLTAVATTTVVKGESEIAFELDTPFEYTGGNLAVEVKVIGAGWTATTLFLGETTSWNSSLSSYKSWSGDKNELNLFLPKAAFTYQVGTAGLLGDVNVDGLVNISDVILMINAIVNDDFSSINMDNADVDASGVVNISDAISLINTILQNN